MNTSQKSGGTSLPAGKNTSITALMYKDRGDVKDLKKYRPISLINVDVKILTKVLTNRLKQVLPSVIHHTQTAVEGRKIDHTIHMLRDLIQIANNQDLEAVFIFLDQEKAFDRVNHDFLFKTMKAFGIGDDFIHWVRLIYSNASTRLKISGSLTNNIPLARGGGGGGEGGGGGGGETGMSPLAPSYMYLSSKS